MSFRFTTIKSLLVVAVSLGLCIGCGQSPSSESPSTSGEQGKKDVHDHGDGEGAHSHAPDPHDKVITEADVERPADFKDAVARIKAYRDAIERDTKTDTPGLAHRPLDEAVIVLGWLAEIADSSKIPEDQLKTINQSANEIVELLDKVHLKIDDKKDPDYPSVAEAVEQAIGRLEAVAETQPAAKTP